MPLLREALDAVQYVEVSTMQQTYLLYPLMGNPDLWWVLVPSRPLGPDMVMNRAAVLYMFREVILREVVVTVYVHQSERLLDTYYGHEQAAKILQKAFKAHMFRKKTSPVIRNKARMLRELRMLPPKVVHRGFPGGSAYHKACASFIERIAPRSPCL